MPPRDNLEHALTGPDSKQQKNQSGKSGNNTPQSNHPSGVHARGGGGGFVDTRMSGRERRSVFKQEVERRSRLNPQLRRAVEARGGVPKPYDAAMLRDVSSHSVAQAYIDTLAQDVAAAKWTLVPRDEESDVSEGEIADAERKIQQIHPEKSFRDILEQITRNMLELGDAALIKHYFEGTDELAEAVPMDSARMFKRVDEHGLTEGYLQASFQNLEIVNAHLDLEEVVWLEWSSRTDHVYGHGPVEKGLDVIMLLEELSEKEKKDLMEGMPPGVLSAREDADNPLPVDEYETVKEEFEMNEGERHRIIVSRGEWDYTDFSGNYQELQVLDRSKYWVHVLGAVMKVNPPYAGFDFQEGNKAQNEAQAAAFRQRGFRQTLRQIEESLTRQLVTPDLHEDLRFKFEREQTVEERMENANMLEASAQAAKEWAKNGRTVTVNDDGNITIEDGEITPEDVEDRDEGGDGGLFGSADDAEVHAAPGETDGVETWLSDEELVKHDDMLLQAHREQIQPASLDAIEKRSWSGDYDVPEYVKESIEWAIDEAGAVFSDIESVPDQTVERLEGLLRDELTSGDWSLRGLVDSAKDIWPAVDEEDLEVVLRTESASILNTAREKGYEDREESGRFKFYWEGPDDSRTTDACEELKEETNPDYGGTPVSMTDLKRLEREMTQKHFSNLSYRDDHTVHPNERHTFVRWVDPSPADTPEGGVTA